MIKVHIARRKLPYVFLLSRKAGYDIEVQGFIEDSTYFDPPRLAECAWATELVPKGEDTPDNMRRVEKNVRARARYHYLKQFELVGYA